MAWAAFGFWRQSAPSRLRAINGELRHKLGRGFGHARDQPCGLRSSRARTMPRRPGSSPRAPSAAWTAFKMRSRWPVFSLKILAPRRADVCAARPPTAHGRSGPAARVNRGDAASFRQAAASGNALELAPLAHHAAAELTRSRYTTAAWRVAQGRTATAVSGYHRARNPLSPMPHHFVAESSWTYGLHRPRRKRWQVPAMHADELDV